MTEPRRLAATAIADRVSELLGEETGGTCGYTLHLDSKKSERTRFEVVTEAILTRRLQSDPFLEGVGVVVLDEFHERSVHADLALAFLKETVQARDDLFVLVMSATLDTERLSGYLSAPVMKIPGRLFPVSVEYSPVSVAKAVRDVVRRERSGELSGSVLVFLPGIFEIRRTARELEGQLGSDVEILILHSSVPLGEQRRILRPSGATSAIRIILSSAIAETSLTVPDVCVVVDSGYSRMNKIDVRLGMERLVTVRESLFSAEQRRGRAGRVRSGTCIRLWDKNEIIPKVNVPEILRSDLSSLVLECAAWGEVNLEKIDFFDPPQESAWNVAKELLVALGCMEDGKITGKGRTALSLGLNVRLSCVALCGKKALPVVLRFSEFRDASAERKNQFARDLERRIEKIGTSFFGGEDEALFVLEGFPDRIARLCEAGSDSCVYQFPSGRKALLQEVNGAEWICATDVCAGDSMGKIRAYEKIDSQKALSWVSKRARVHVESEFSGKKLRLETYECLSFGEIVLKKTKTVPTKDDFLNALACQVKSHGIGVLPLSREAQSLLLRARFFGENGGKEMLEKIESLQETCRQWLGPFITSAGVDETAVQDALFWHLDGSGLLRLVPEKIVLENGKTRKLVYELNNSKVQVVLEVIIQEIFGCFSTPRVLGVPVLLRLLSPARRPLQVTQDLEHFWSGSWIEIAKEMKSRYPKHNWDYRVCE